MSDIDFHGFIAKKQRLRGKTIITESRLGHVVVGSVINYLNGTALSDLQPLDVIKLFQSRTVKLIPSRSAIPEVTDCCFHGFAAKKYRKSNKIIVTESMDPLLAVGTILKSVNGIASNDLTRCTLSKMFACRRRKVVFEKIRHELQSDSSIDAKNYSKSYDEMTMFCTCALCGEEGPSKGSVQVADCKEMIVLSNVTSLYANLISCLTDESSPNTYDRAFAEEIRTHLPGGLLRGETKLCRICHKSLNKKMPVVSKSNGSSQASINEEQETETINEYRNIPKDALINGLFPGRIPNILIALTDIEQSMIAIYSSITKVSLHGGKNYSLNGALCYTIINDLTNIARSLPRMPSVESIAILRQASGKRNKDYSYRPYFVKMALIWLKENNHLYENISYNWPVQHNWDDINASGEVPYLPLTEDDISAIDENDCETSNGNGNMSNLSGIMN